MNNKSILITGGAGLVGTELIKQLLADGQKVTALCHHTPLSIHHPSLNIVQCDILDVESLDELMVGVSHIYHCAAMVSFSPKQKRNLFAINIEGTANVVNAAITAGVTKMVHVSSVAALGRIREGELVTEEMNWSEESSNSIYGKSKFLGEMEVWRGIGEGLSAVIVNPSLILGAGDWTKGSVEIFKNAYEEFPWFTEGISGFVDVRDVARCMILLMNSNIINERFIVSAENTPFKTVFTEMADGFNKKPPSKMVTPFIAGLVWRWEALKSTFSGKDPLLTNETVRTAQAKVYFDNRKLLKYLPEFQYHPVRDTIKDTCKTLQQMYKLL